MELSFCHVFLEDSSYTQLSATPNSALLCSCMHEPKNGSAGLTGHPPTFFHVQSFPSPLPADRLSPFLIGKK